MKYLAGPVVTREKIDYAEKYFAKYFGNTKVFNKAGWEYILEKHNGFLPLEIFAVPEGTVLPSHLPLVTILNTDPNCAWLTNYVETIIMQVWSPITVASRSLQSKKSILKYLKVTGTPETIDFKLHDFGYRGVSSNETAGLAGAAHLVHFKGSDTLAANDLILKYYENGNLDKMPSFSIPASEHSTITSWGRESEVEAFENILDNYPEGLVACVSDSFDIEKACTELWGGVLKDKVLNRKGTLVVRPDSGNPITMPETVISALAKKFGGQRNSKGYYVLPDQVRVIQSDGIEDYRTIEDILSFLLERGWSADNIAFGSGGGLLQKINRDTMKFAIKCSAVNIKGVWHEVYKEPKDDKFKASKRGLVTTYLTPEGKYVSGTLLNTSTNSETTPFLNKVFSNGRVFTTSFSEIRDRAAKFL